MQTMRAMAKGSRRRVVGDGLVLIGARVETAKAEAYRAKAEREHRKLTDVVRMLLDEWQAKGAA